MHCCMGAINSTESRSAVADPCCPAMLPCVVYKALPRTPALCTADAPADATCADIAPMPPSRLAQVGSLPSQLGAGNI